MRCQAYQLPAGLYRKRESAILRSLHDNDRAQLVELVQGHDLAVDLMSGEWRLLFASIKDFANSIDPKSRRARMAVAPEELAEFVEALRQPALQKKLAPISFGLAELTDALPQGCDLVGLLIFEEDDDWLWTEPSNEIVAIRSEIFDLLEPYIRSLIELQDYSVLSRLCSDHGDGEVELSDERWRKLTTHAQERVPELITLFKAIISLPSDYTSIREALALVSDPVDQPSLDAWLRIHADADQYALYFRDASRERS